MAYLLIPAVLFIAVACFVWWTWRPDFERYKMFGGLDYLKNIVPIIATSRVGQPTLVISAAGRVASITIEFRADHADLEIDFGKKPAKKRMRAALEFIASDGETPAVVEAGDGRKLVSIRKTCPPEELRAYLEELSPLVLTTRRPPKNYGFDIWAHYLDVGIIHVHVIRLRPDDDPSEMKSPNAERSLQELKDTRKGCLNDLVAVLLRPLPFVAAFYLFDLRVAAGVFVATLAIHIAVARRLNANRRKTRRRSNVLTLVALAGCLVFVATGTPFYLQIVPTVACVVLALEAGYSWLTDGEMIKGEAPEGAYTATESGLLHGALILVVLLGALVNEHLRPGDSLTLWVWYFAYLRIELMLGYLIASAPANLLQMRRIEKHRAKASS